MSEWFRHVADNPTQAAIVAAWFAGGASLIGAFVSIIVSVIAAATSFFVARRSVYINSVTAERSKWIDALRRSIAEYSGTAERVYARQRDKTYADSPEWAADVQSLRTHSSSLKLRLNPREIIAQNFLDAARKLDQAARIYRWADVELANEIMVRHGQWILEVRVESGEVGSRFRVREEKAQASTGRA